MPQSSGDGNFRLDVIKAVFLTLIALLSYSNTFNVPFVFDDLPNITRNPLIRMTGVTPDAFARLFEFQGTRPLANLSFALNYYFHGYDVVGYHVVNLVIHIITGLLVWLVGRQTLRLCAVDYPMLPFWAGLLWLVNPVHTQSVTYVVQRMNTLASLFFMLALYCYITARKLSISGENPLKRYLFYGLCLVSAVSGLASKEIVATLPIILLLYEWYFFQKADFRWLKKRLPRMGLAVSAIVVLAVVYLGTNPINAIFDMYDRQSFSLAQRLLTEPQVVLYYVSLLFFPFPSRLNVDYQFPLADSFLNPITTLPALVALAALVIFAVYSARKHRLVSFSVLWFLVTLSVESSFIGLALIFEHRAYLPSIFPFIALLCLGFSVVRPKPFLIGTLVTAIVFCGFMTYKRNTDWKDTLTFWQNTADKSPRKARPANGVGIAYQSLRQTETALEWFRKSVRLDPEYDEPYDNIGGALVNLGRSAEAVPYLNKAIALNPESYKAYSNLGSAMQRLNRLDEAVSLYQKALAIFPDYEIARNNLGAVLTKTGDITTALHHLKLAVRINPNYDEPHNNLGLAMTQLGRTREAINCYEKALRLNPENSTAHFNLGTIWFQKNDLDRAGYHLQQAVRLDPKGILPLNNLTTVLVIQEKYEEALANLRRLLVLRPESPTVYYNMACVYALQNSRPEAVAALKKAIALGYDRWEHMTTDPDLANIHGTDYFKSLVRQKVERKG